MKLQISYSELESIIREKTGQSVEIGYVDPQTIELRKDMKVFMVHKKVSINLEVIKVERTDLVLKYNAGLGLEMAAKGFLMFFKEILSGIVDDKGSNTLVVHLDQIEKLRGALSAVSLQSICFDDKATIILFLLKT